jgi:hypothetical protein
MVPKLADAYASLGDTKKALKILERASGKSSYPHYFMGHMAFLLIETGEIDQGMLWRERAMRAARGTSTRIQWTWSYLQSVEKSNALDKVRRIEMGVADLFKRSLQVSDGFNGRNRRYLDKTAELILRLPTPSKKIISTLESSQRQCKLLKEAAQLESCSKYFESLAQNLAKASAVQEDPNTKTN